MKILSKLDNTGMIEEVEDKRYVSDAEKAEWNSKADKTYVDNQDALKADKTYVDSKVKTDVPVGAKFTDTVYIHPETHPASMITDLPTGKKVARFVVGTSTAGWTASDCDYLCDGTADDTEINAAINALPATGGEVVILDGTYNITAPINVAKDNVSIRGNGNATILKRMFVSDVPEGLIMLIGRRGCKIANLQIEGNEITFSYSNYIIYLEASSNNTITGNTCNNSYYGIYLSSSSDNTVTDNTGNHTSVGIYLEGSSNNIVTGNTSNNTEAGFYLERASNNVVTGNTFNNGEYGIYLDSLSNNNTVTGNTCNDNNVSGIFLNFSSNNTVTGNTCIRGTGLSMDYTVSQHTIQLGGTNNSYNLISNNNCMGKAVTNEGGAGNSVYGNKYDSGDYKDFTQDEKTKLAGISDGANKYTHPDSHPASMITESSTKRFVSDIEKNNWDNKAETSDIPTKVSQLQNDSNYTTQTYSIMSESEMDARTSSTGRLLSAQRLAYLKNKIEEDVEYTIDFKLEWGLYDNVGITRLPDLHLSSFPHSWPSVIDHLNTNYNMISTSAYSKYTFYLLRIVSWYSSYSYSVIMENDRVVLFPSRGDTKSPVSFSGVVIKVTGTGTDNMTYVSHREFSIDDIPTASTSDNKLYMVSRPSLETIIDDKLSGLTKSDVGLGNVDNTSDASKPISTATQTALDGKVNNSQVLTNVPSGAKFTDTITTINNKTGAITKADITALGIPAQDTVVDISGKADKTYVDDKVKTDVPEGAEFTDTITTINGKTGAISKADITALGIPAQDTVYTHPESHPASMITESSTKRFVSDTEKANWDNKWDYDESTIKAVKVSSAGHADSADTASKLGLFDAEYYATMPYLQDVHDSIQNSLDNKVNNSRVLTDVPANAEFTDTVTTINGKTGAISKADITALGIPAQDTVVDISGKADKTYVDNKVKTDVPVGAKFTDTTYADNQFPNTAEAIGASKNLNNYTTPGFYYQSANANASNGSNYPAAVAGTLVVTKDAGLTQMYYAYDGSGVYYRHYYNTWGSWQNLLKPTWANVSSKPTTATRWPTWSEVTSKPSTFAPSSHTHTWAQVTGKPAQATRWPAWAEVTGKPVSFTRLFNGNASAVNTNYNMTSYSGYEFIIVGAFMDASSNENYTSVVIPTATISLNVPRRYSLSVVFNATTIGVGLIFFQFNSTTQFKINNIVGSYSGKISYIYGVNLV